MPRPPASSRRRPAGMRAADYPIGTHYQWDVFPHPPRHRRNGFEKPARIPAPAASGGKTPDVRADGSNAAGLSHGRSSLRTHSQHPHEAAPPACGLVRMPALRAFANPPSAPRSRACGSQADRRRSLGLAGGFREPRHRSCPKTPRRRPLTGRRIR